MADISHLFYILRSVQIRLQSAAKFLYFPDICTDPFYGSVLVLNSRQHFLCRRSLLLRDCGNIHYPVTDGGHLRRHGLGLFKAQFYFGVRIVKGPQNDPRILQGAQKSLNLRLFPLELERFRSLCAEANMSQREFLIALMDLYEATKKAGEK